MVAAPDTAAQLVQLAQALRRLTDHDLEETASTRLLVMAARLVVAGLPMLDACRSALDAGVPLAIHSDAPITPLAPLFTAWCAVQRLTASGQVLGLHQRITVPEALHAITLGAAITLKLDGEIGSIECGKRADFCVLDDDPTTIDPMHLKDLRPWGTVQGGRVFKA